MSWVLLILITGFISWIEVRSLLALRAGTFLPREPVVAGSPIGSGS